MLWRDYRHVTWRSRASKVLSHMGMARHCSGAELFDSRSQTRRFPSDAHSPPTLMQQPQHLDEIRRDAHRRDLAARARALDDQRVIAVPLGVEGDDVVAALQRGDGVALVELLQPDLDRVRGTSTLPTKRTTLPSFSASCLSASIWPSCCGSSSRNSSPERQPSSCLGMSDWTGNEVGDSSPGRRGAPGW